jgi:GrpB-like predicted nucleotidyltransferase (UPF0157 family)
MKKIILEDHDPRWAAYFLELKEIYVASLGGLFLSIEHVGSTSIPGIKAKPILDIDIVIADSATFPDVVRQLEKLGYLHEGDLGIKGREAFKRLSAETPVRHPRREWPKHNLYVCRQGAASLQNHLLFRDYLRDHPEEALQYQRLKEQLAGTVNDDIDRYVDGKTQFIRGILTKAGFDVSLI